MGEINYHLAAELAKDVNYDPDKDATNGGNMGIAKAEGLLRKHNHNLERFLFFQMCREVLKTKF